MVAGSAKSLNFQELWFTALHAKKPWPRRKLSRSEFLLIVSNTEKTSPRFTAYSRSTDELVRIQGNSSPRSTPANRLVNQARNQRITPSFAKKRLARFHFCISRSRRDWAANARAYCKTHRSHAR